MWLSDKLQKKLEARGYIFADAAVLIKKVVFTGIVSFGLWCVLCIEIKYNPEDIMLPWFVGALVFVAGASVPICNILLGKVDYEITCFKETLQIHRLCMFLKGYKELGMEDVIKWLVKFADKYYAVLRRILLYPATGRAVAWEYLSEECGRNAGIRTLRVMWMRIFEQIKEMDMLSNSCSAGLFRSQFEYADKVCYEHIVRLQNRKIFVCKIIAYLPVFCTIIFYMIYPFVLEGVNLLNTYSEEMKALGLN